MRRMRKRRTYHARMGCASEEATIIGNDFLSLKSTERGRLIRPRRGFVWPRDSIPRLSGRHIAKTAAAKRLTSAVFTYEKVPLHGGRLGLSDSVLACV